MARRAQPPQTAFGAWLTAWLDDHREQWTLAAFAQAVGVSSSAVSLWKSTTKHVKIEHLRAVARVTNEPLENLQRMVYGGRTPFAGVTREVRLTEEELEALVTRAVETALRRVFGEGEGGRAA